MSIIYRVHAMQRMFERDISESVIPEILKNNDVIESYPDDKPYPSFLVLGFDGSRPIHVVYAKDEENNPIVITVYEPDLTKWENDFKTRKTL